MSALKKISIKGFKSIKELVDFELSDLNVFIGANGSGKSNLIEFFIFSQKVAEGIANIYVRKNGGFEDFVFNGIKETQKISAEFQLKQTELCSYSIVGTISPPSSCIIEEIKNISPSILVGGIQPINTVRNLTTFVAEKIKSTKQVFASWQIFHLNDTSKTASIRRTEKILDDKYLRGDAANLAPFLFKLKNHHPKSYQEIVNSVQLVMPYFYDFQLDIKDFGKGKEINLAWTQQGSDYPFSPFHLSDGSIRFIALATALLQPEPPSTIIIDEPELGLHPAAIHILSELIKDASKRTQVIVATQSPILIDNFGIKDIVVVNRENGASTFKRLNEEDFNVWLEDYSVGELWTKNVIAGGPVSE